jgi:hypothetical protein
MYYLWYDGDIRSTRNTPLLCAVRSRALFAVVSNALKDYNGEFYSHERIGDANLGET